MCRRWPASRRLLGDLPVGHPQRRLPSSRDAAAAGRQLRRLLGIIGADSRVQDLNTTAPHSAIFRIVFGVSLVFVLVLIIGVFGDLWTRNEMTLPSAAPSTEGPEIGATAPVAPPAAHE